MIFHMEDDNGKTKAYELPDDYRMDEFYCYINGIGETASDDEVHKRMVESKDAVVTQNGNFIPFSAYANASTTLAQLGINENSVYRLAHGFDKDRGNGANDE